MSDGNDAISRVAKVKTATGELIRSIHKLRKLPINPTEPPILAKHPVADSYSDESGKDVVMAFPIRVQNKVYPINLEVN